MWSVLQLVCQLKVIQHPGYCNIGFCSETLANTKHVISVRFEKHVSLTRSNAQCLISTARRSCISNVRVFVLFESKSICWSCLKVIFWANKALCSLQLPHHPLDKTCVDVRTFTAESEPTCESGVLSAALRNESLFGCCERTSSKQSLFCISVRPTRATSDLLSRKDNRVVCSPCSQMRNVDYQRWLCVERTIAGRTRHPSQSLWLPEHSHAMRAFVSIRDHHANRKGQSAGLHKLDFDRAGMPPVSRACAIEYVAATSEVRLIEWLKRGWEKLSQKQTVTSSPVDHDSVTLVERYFFFQAFQPKIKLTTTREPRAGKESPSLPRMARTREATPTRTAVYTASLPSIPHCPTGPRPRSLGAALPPSVQVSAEGCLLATLPSECRDLVPTPTS